MCQVCLVQVLPQVQSRVLVDPPDPDHLVWSLGIDGPAFDFKILHFGQTLPDTDHVVLADLNHDAVLDNAGLGRQARRGLESTVENDKTGSGHCAYIDNRILQCGKSRCNCISTFSSLVHDIDGLSFIVTHARSGIGAVFGWIGLNSDQMRVGRLTKA